MSDDGEKGLTYLKLGDGIPFTQVSNEVLQAPELSWRAKGVYSYMASKATMQGWQFRRSHLIKASKEGRDALVKAITELKEFGVLEIVPRQAEDKKTFTGWNWILYAHPKKSRMTENPSFGKSDVRVSRRSENQSLFNKTEVNNTHTNNTEKRRGEGEQKNEAQKPFNRSAAPETDNKPHSIIKDFIKTDINKKLSGNQLKDFNYFLSGIVNRRSLKPLYQLYDNVGDKLPHDKLVRELAERIAKDVLSHSHNRLAAAGLNIFEIDIQALTGKVAECTIPAEREDLIDIVITNTLVELTEVMYKNKIAV